MMGFHLKILAELPFVLAEYILRALIKVQVNQQALLEDDLQQHGVKDRVFFNIGHVAFAVAIGAALVFVAPGPHVLKPDLHQLRQKI